MVTRESLRGVAREQQLNRWIDFLQAHSSSHRPLIRSEILEEEDKNRRPEKWREQEATRQAGRGYACCWKNNIADWNGWLAGNKRSVCSEKWPAAAHIHVRWLVGSQKTGHHQLHHRFVMDIARYGLIITSGNGCLLRFLQGERIGSECRSKWWLWIVMRMFGWLF